jgi:hypothetical protein
VLGVAVQLCTLPWLGLVPEDVPPAPAAAMARLSDRLGIPVGELRGYGAREQTRSDHLRDVAAYLGWRQVDRPHWKDLEEFLFARAMEHDSPKLLVAVTTSSPAGTPPGREAGPGAAGLLGCLTACRSARRKGDEPAALPAVEAAAPGPAPPAALALAGTSPKAKATHITPMMPALRRTAASSRSSQGDGQPHQTRHPGSHTCTRRAPGRPGTAAGPLLSRPISSF